MDKPWSWVGLSQNPNITFDIVEKYIDKPWSWYGLSQNPNITFDFVEKHMDKPWVWSSLSYNPNITFDFIKKYIDKWSHRDFMANPFTIEKEIFIESIRKKRIMKRNREFEEELIAKVFHPKRIQKMLLLDINYLEHV